MPPRQAPTAKPLDDGLLGLLWDIESLKQGLAVWCTENPLVDDVIERFDNFADISLSNAHGSIFLELRESRKKQEFVTTRHRTLFDWNDVVMNEEDSIAGGMRVLCAMLGVDDFVAMVRNKNCAVDWKKLCDLAGKYVLLGRHCRV